MCNGIRTGILRTSVSLSNKLWRRKVCSAYVNKGVDALGTTLITASFVRNRTWGCQWAWLFQSCNYRGVIIKCTTVSRRWKMWKTIRALRRTVINFYRLKKGDGRLDFKSRIRILISCACNSVHRHRKTHHVLYPCFISSLPWSFPLFAIDNAGLDTL